MYFDVSNWVSPGKVGTLGQDVAFYQEGLPSVRLSEHYENALRFTLEALGAAAQETEDLPGGTTVSGALLLPRSNQFLTFNIGDSRTRAQSGAKLFIDTQDHTPGYDPELPEACRSFLIEGSNVAINTACDYLKEEGACVGFRRYWRTDDDIVCTVTFPEGLQCTERDRILRTLFERVNNKYDFVLRVERQLAMTRAISGSNIQYVSYKPDINIHEWGTEPLHIVAATDGFWDSLTKDVFDLSLDAGSLVTSASAAWEAARTQWIDGRTERDDVGVVAFHAYPEAPSGPGDFKLLNAPLLLGVGDGHGTYGHIHAMLMAGVLKAFIPLVLRNYNLEEGFDMEREAGSACEAIAEKIMTALSASHVAPQKLTEILSAFSKQLLSRLARVPGAYHNVMAFELYQALVTYSVSLNDAIIVDRIANDKKSQELHEKKLLGVNSLITIVNNELLEIARLNLDDLARQADFKTMCQGYFTHRFQDLFHRAEALLPLPVMQPTTSASVEGAFSASAGLRGGGGSGAGPVRASVPACGAGAGAGR